MEVELTLKVTKNFPNNAGEIGLYDLYPQKYVLDTDFSGYRIKPEIWIGEKGLWGSSLPSVYNNQDLLYLIVFRDQQDIDINTEVEAGRAIEIDLEMAKRIIDTNLRKGLVSATSCTITKVNGDYLLQSGRAVMKK